MRIESPQPGGDPHETSLTLKQGKRAYEIYYRSDTNRLTPCVEASAALVLLGCMRRGWGLTLDDPVSPRLAKGLESIQEIFRGWSPELHYVEVEHSLAVPTPSETGGRGVGCFFTGGVDSFYTLLRHREEITDLIFVHGFDIELENHALRDQVSKQLREAADAYGKRLIEVETNVRRTFSSRVSKWGVESHGGALASVGHQLANDLHKIYIASSYAYQELFPWGTHPAVDRHWSSESLEFVHDGCETNRLGKVASIASSDAAMKHLRVCFENRDASYNCGRCEKCLRTMVELKAVGAFDRCSSFSEPLVNERVARILGNDCNHRPFYGTALHALERSGGDPELIQALRVILDRPRLKEKVLRSLERRKGKREKRARRAARRGRD